MKKVLIVLLAVFVLLAVVFFWKGGHHALALSEVLEQWLDADSSDQTVTIHCQTGGYTVDPDTGKLSSDLEQWSLSADTFWTEYGGDRILGLSAWGMSAYLRDNCVYTDTGRAYALPDLSGILEKADKLKAGLLLRGRITKTGDTYHLTMKTDELELSASITADPILSSVTVDAVFPDGMILRFAVTPKAAQAHPLPQPVTDAMVRTAMEPPMLLEQPMEVLQPVMRSLFPLRGELTLGVQSGILELSETVGFEMTSRKAVLDRKGILVEFDLPDAVNQLQPELLALGLLYSGTYSQEDDTALVRLELSGENAAALIARLVPQAEDLGLTCQPAEVVLTMHNSKLCSVAISAEGSVPFLFTTIPLSFTAELNAE